MAKIIDFIYDFLTFLCAIMLICMFWIGVDYMIDSVNPCSQFYRGSDICTRG